MAEPTLACASYPSKYFSCRVFSDISSHRIVSLLHWGLLTKSSPAGPLLLKTYAFPPNIDFSAHDGTNCRFSSILSRRNPFGFTVARLQTLRPATAARAWYSQ